MKATTRWSEVNVIMFTIPICHVLRARQPILLMKTKTKILHRPKLSKHNTLPRTANYTLILYLCFTCSLKYCLGSWSVQRSFGRVMVTRVNPPNEKRDLTKILHLSNPPVQLSCSTFSGSIRLRCALSVSRACCAQIYICDWRNKMIERDIDRPTVSLWTSVAESPFEVHRACVSVPPLPRSISR